MHVVVYSEQKSKSRIWQIFFTKPLQYHYTTHANKILIHDDVME
jgi:hypothetical protein